MNSRRPLDRPGCESGRPVILDTEKTKTVDFDFLVSQDVNPMVRRSGCDRVSNGNL
jgi:hypothetical protein